jgi:hypothetical protein
MTSIIHQNADEAMKFVKEKSKFVEAELEKLAKDNGIILSYAYSFPVRYMNGEGFGGNDYTEIPDSFMKVINNNQNKLKQCCIALSAKLAKQQYTLLDSVVGGSKTNS